MAQLYRITPLHKKSIEYYVEVYSKDDQGNVRTWSVSETYRWGQGFRELDNEVYENEIDCVTCDPQLGWGCELDDLNSVWFDFDDSFTDEERAEIERHWDQEDEEGRWGTAWLYDGEHEWRVDYDCVNISGPIRIDLVDEDRYNEAVEADIKPQPVVIPEGWPFPTEEIK